jgi:arginase
VEGAVRLIAIPRSFTGREDVGPGVGPLAALLAERLGVAAEVFEPDVAAIRATLDAAEGFPVVVSSECSIALATLPWLAARHPDAWVLWLDAHGDFNTPDISPSGYTAGMAAAGGTGQWDAGVAPTLPAERLVFAGVRDVDPGERDLLDASGAVVAASLDAAADALGDAPVFVHLDCDVVDGYPSAFPTPGGPSADDVATLLNRVAREHEVVGVTIASVAGAPDLPADLVEPLLP